MEAENIFLERTKLVHFGETVNEAHDQYRKTIARGYKKAKGAAWRSACEEFTVFQRLGNLRDKICLDLACGDGFYTRRLVEIGHCSRAIGVDLSPEMIVLARDQESKQPLGVEYVCADGTTFEPRVDVKQNGGFDVVVASYFLNYAETKETLHQMCQAVAKNLKRGGQFVAINDNITVVPSVEMNAIWANKWRKYGVAKFAHLEDARDGMRIAYELWCVKVLHV